MRSWRRIIVANSIACLACATFSLYAGEPKKKEESRIHDGAYYEFRGHVSDRNTLERSFTLGWNKGSQQITVTTETKIFRLGKAAKLEEAKAGDAARGVGQASNGKLVAVAVAFGSEGVELPRTLKIPDSITLPPKTGD